MELTVLKAKIHRATVTQADLNYVGSITIDKKLMEQSGILEYEQVQIVDINNGSRFETYVIQGEAESGVICLNGAAARMVAVGDKIIIMCYARMSEAEARANKPTVLFMNDRNQTEAVRNGEVHGEIGA